MLHLGALILLLSTPLLITLTVAQRHSRWRPLFADLAVTSTLLSLCVLFFWRLFFDAASIPRGGGDLVSQLYPAYSLTAQALRDGDFPLWNPFLFSGMPLQADVQSSVFYPPNALFFLLDSRFGYRVLELLVVFHFAFASCTMYGLCRYFKLSRLASLLGAIIFAYSGFMVAHLGHYNMVAAAVWLPLQLLLLDRVLRSASLAAGVVLAGVLAISFFAGHPQITIYVMIALALYVVLFVVQASRSKTTRGMIWNVSFVPAWLLLAAAFMAVQVLPSLELLQHTLRADISYEEAIQFQAEPATLITLVIPHWFGPHSSDFWGPSSLTETFGYLGVSALILAGAAVVVSRHRLVLFAGVLGLFALAAAMGSHTPVHGWLFSLVPGFDTVRSPGRLLYLFNFAAAILAALGLDAFLTHYRLRLKNLWRITLVASIPLAIVLLALMVQVGSDGWARSELHAVTTSLNSTLMTGVLLCLAAGFFFLTTQGRLTPKLGGLSIVAVVFLDLLVAGSRMHPTHTNLTEGFEHVNIVNFLKQDSDLYRVDSVTGINNIVQPNFGNIHQIPGVWGLPTPFALADYYWYWKKHISGRSSPLYDFLGAKYVIAKKDVELDWDKFKPVYTEDYRLNVYLNTRALPRFFLVSNAVHVPNQEAALQAIKDPDFDPRHTVVIEKTVERRPIGSPSNSRSVRVNHYGFDVISISVETSGPSYLVGSEVFYPGWQVRVDGQPAVLHRANALFRAVYIPGGRHEVELAFRPTSFTLGAWVSGVAWVGTVLGFGGLILRRRYFPWKKSR